MSFPSPSGRDSRFQISSLLRITPERPSEHSSKSREPLSPPVDQNIEQQHVAPASPNPRNLTSVRNSFAALSKASHTLRLAVRVWETSTNNAINDILNEITHDSENLRSKLEETQTKLEETQTKLEETQTKLEETQTKLEETQTKLEETQTKLEETQTKLEETQTKLTEVEIEKSRLEAELLGQSEGYQRRIDTLTQEITENQEAYNRFSAAREAESQERLSNQAQEYRIQSQKAFEDFEKSKKNLQDEIERSKKAADESRLSLNNALEREKRLEEEMKKSTAEISFLREKLFQLEEAMKLHEVELRATKKKHFDMGVEKGLEMGDTVKEAEARSLRQMIVISRSEGESEGFKAGREAGYKEGLEVANGRSNYSPGQDLAQTPTTLASDTIVVVSSINDVDEMSPLAQTEEGHQAFEKNLPQSKLEACHQILLAFEDAGGNMVKYKIFLRHAFRNEHYRFFHPYLTALEEWDWTPLPLWLEDADVTDPSGMFLKKYQDMAEALGIFDYTTFQMAVLEYAQKHDLIEQDYQDSFNVRRLKVYLATCILEFWSKDLYFKRDIFYNSCLTCRLFEFAYCSLFAQESGSILGSNQRADAERREKALAAQNASKTIAFACSMLDLAPPGTVSCSPSPQISVTGLPNPLKRSAPEQSYAPQKRAQTEPSSATIIDLRSPSSSPTENRGRSTLLVEIPSNLKSASEITPTRAPTPETTTKRRIRPNKRYGY